MHDRHLYLSGPDPTQHHDMHAHPALQSTKCLSTLACHNTRHNQSRKKGGIIPFLVYQKRTKTTTTTKSTSLSKQPQVQQL